MASNGELLGWSTEHMGWLLIGRTGMGTQNMPNIYIYIYACTCISYCFHAHIWLAVDQRLSNPGKRHAVR